MATTVFNKPLDNEVASLNEQLGKFVFTRITGTTPSSAGQRTTIAYPTGFTSANCMVVAGYVLFDNTYYSLGFPGIYANLYSDGVGFGLTSTDGGAFVSKPFAVILMRFDLL